MAPDVSADEREVFRVMLAALRSVQSYFRSMDADNPEAEVLRAIAAAETVLEPESPADERDGAEAGTGRSEPPTP